MNRRGGLLTGATGKLAYAPQRRHPAQLQLARAMIDTSKAPQPPPTSTVGNWTYPLPFDFAYAAKPGRRGLTDKMNSPAMRKKKDDFGAGLKVSKQNIKPEDHPAGPPKYGELSQAERAFTLASTFLSGVLA